jgi:hypothetical protein
MEKWRPITSLSSYPFIRLAPGFQLTTRPSELRM